MEMGTQSRCFCDVSDAVRAIIGLAQHPEAPGRVYNIGGSEDVTIRELAETVKVVTESCSEIVHIPYTEAYARGFEDMRPRVPDTTRIQALLGLGIFNFLSSRFWCAYETICRQDSQVRRRLPRQVLLLRMPVC